MWIYIPEDDEKEAWVGTVSVPEGPKSGWNFELIRHVEFEDLYRTKPFDEKDTVIGLLDYQQKCTLIRPLIQYIDPGTLGMRFDPPRTRITGEFQALLTDIPVENSDDKIFTSFSFDSNLFAAWYSPPSYRTDFDFNTKTHLVEVKSTETRTFDIKPFGKVTCTSGADLSSDMRLGTIRSAAVFRFDFYEPVSLKEVINVCTGIERLFCFLIGFRGKPPVYNVWINETYRVDDREFAYDGKLDIGGLDWKDGKPPHPMDCVHLNGWGDGTLELILSNFLNEIDGLVSRIHAIELSRFFSKNLNERFSIVMPILESYVRAKYFREDEVEYINLEKSFFEWIDASGCEEYKEFSRKHLSVKKSKSPSLTTLLSRAINRLNVIGFDFDPGYAERIQKRRARMFHSCPRFQEGEVSVFYDEVRAATGILMLHTYLDLGIDISYLKNKVHALRDMRDFLPKKQ